MCKFVSYVDDFIRSDTDMWITFSLRMLNLWNDSLITGDVLDFSEWEFCMGSMSNTKMCLWESVLPSLPYMNPLRYGTGCATA